MRRFAVNTKLKDETPEMREPGEEPQFDRLISEVEQARNEWRLGNRGKAERMLKVVASIAYAEASERKPGSPVAETTYR